MVTDDGLRTRRRRDGWMDGETGIWSVLGASAVFVQKGSERLRSTRMKSSIWKKGDPAG